MFGLFKKSKISAATVVEFTETKTVLEVQNWIN